MNQGGQANATARRKSAPSGSTGKSTPSTTIVEVDLIQWRSLTPAVRQSQLALINVRFHDLISELYESANLCVDRHRNFIHIHNKWRSVVIVGTGVVALTNLFALNKNWKDFAGGLIPILAAAFAIALTTLASLESFYNSSEKAQAYRESRELFLDAARDFDRRWDVQVQSLTDTPEACVNAAELYRLLVLRDTEIRAKFKELTRIEGKVPKK